MRFNGRDYPEEYVVCRYRRHVYSIWKGFFRHEGKIVDVSECESCGRQRFVYYNRNMERLGTSVLLPAGYTITRTKEEREKGVTFTAHDAARALLKSRGVEGTLPSE